MRFSVVAVLLLVLGAPLFAQAAPADSTRQVLSRTEPVYPDLAVRLHLAGLVNLRVTVARDGTAKRISTAGGNPVLAKAAQDAVARWKWAPASGETVEVVQFNFHPK